jgi:hypothetical protein
MRQQDPRAVYHALQAEQEIIPLNSAMAIWNVYPVCFIRPLVVRPVQYSTSRWACVIGFLTRLVSVAQDQRLRLRPHQQRQSQRHNQ